MIKPKRLRPGDTAAVVSLSHGMLGEPAFLHKFHIARERMERDYGVRLIAMPNALRGIDYLYEHPEARAQDLMDAMTAVDSPLTSMSAKDALESDAKLYTEGSRRFMLAQIEESHFSLFHRCIPALERAMDEAMGEKALDFIALMATDPVRGNSELLYRGDEGVRRALPYRKGPDGTLLMPGVLSRKKQLLPEVLAAI